MLDVWEHAYYLQHKNMHGKYVSNWWSVTHWAAASRLQQWWREVRGDTEEEEEVGEGEEEEWEREERERVEREESNKRMREEREGERDEKERESEEIQHEEL